MDEQKNKFMLHETHGETSIFIDVEVDENENVVLSGQDVGKAPKGFWGDSDYEYWIIVNRDQKDFLLLSLIEKAFGGTHDAFSRFREFLVERGIPYEYGSWI